MRRVAYYFSSYYRFLTLLSQLLTFFTLSFIEMSVTFVSEHVKSPFIHRARPLVYASSLAA